MSITVDNFEIYLSTFALLVSILAYANHRKTRKLAEKTYQIALSTKHVTEIEALKSMPQLDLLGIVSVGELNRAKLLISNMRSTPFRINSVCLEKYAPKVRSVKNIFKSKFDQDFDWYYEKVDGYRWNPMGNLDYEEKYQSEAAEFLTVKEQEKILITIPDYSEYKTYRFSVKTSHGNVDISGSISKNGKVHFCNDFRQSFN